MPEYHDSFVGDVEVEEVLVVIGDSRSIALAHDAVPGRPVQLVHVQLDTYIVGQLLLAMDSWSVSSSSENVMKMLQMKFITSSFIIGYILCYRISRFRLP